MKQKKWKEYINLLVKLGFTMFSCIVGGFFISYFFQKTFNFHSSVLILGTFSGVGLGFYFIYLQLKKFF